MIIASVVDTDESRRSPRGIRMPSSELAQSDETESLPLGKGRCIKAAMTLDPRGICRK